jgi:hypothetical protein
MKSALLLFIFIAALTATLNASERASPPAKTAALLSFEFLGCSGDPSEEIGTPKAWRFESQNKVTFLVRHSESCGFDRATNAAATYRNGHLDISYRLASSNNMAAACECEYWAKFTVGSAARKVPTITFNNVPVRLAGTWPSGL